MIIENTQNKIETNQVLPETEFGISQKDTGLLIEILQGKMYRNPIEAICREIASNSRDANREANTTNPVEISFYNSNPYLPHSYSIEFRDYGNGMSPDTIKTVFTQYGASTKRHSDSFTGGFGLGAKTPFAYTDNFNIITRYNGFEYHWVAALDQNRSGKMVLVFKKLTTETGTSILIPIKKEDQDKFKSAVHKTVFYWKDPYVIKGVDLKINKNTYYENSDGAIYQEPYYTDYSYKPIALVDDIIYPLKENIPLISGMALKFSNGEIRVSSSREELYYDNFTQTAIINKLQSFYQKVKSQLEEILTPLPLYHIFELEKYYKALSVRDIMKLKNLHLPNQTCAVYALYKNLYDYFTNNNIPVDPLVWNGVANPKTFKYNDVIESTEIVTYYNKISTSKIIVKKQNCINCSDVNKTIFVYSDNPNYNLFREISRTTKLPVTILPCHFRQYFTGIAPTNTHTITEQLTYLGYAGIKPLELNEFQERYTPGVKPKNPELSLSYKGFNKIKDCVFFTTASYYEVVEKKCVLYEKDGQHYMIKNKKFEPLTNYVIVDDLKWKIFYRYITRKISENTTFFYIKDYKGPKHISENFPKYKEIYIKYCLAETLCLFNSTQTQTIKYFNNSPTSNTLRPEIANIITFEDPELLKHLYNIISDELKYSQDFFQKQFNIVNIKNESPLFKKIEDIYNLFKKYPLIKDKNDIFSTQSTIDHLIKYLNYFYEL